MVNEIKHAYLKEHPLFLLTSEETIQKACATTRIKSYFKGEILHNGETGNTRFYFLIKGKVKICELREDHNELIKELLNSPDIFGDTGLSGYSGDAEYAEVLTNNTLICSMPINDMRELLENDSRLAISYVNLVNKKLKKLEGRHSDLVFKDAKSRLIHFIKNWASEDGKPEGDSIIISNYLTHTDIANAISTSRQSVNVILNELRELGMLYYTREKIELRNSLFNAY
ncbi:MAG TPA: Crp/Fnr family transcriptional regulator [Flavisolibacter sp.]|jgi:CRP/FNR family transcriptional regulator|nr:Crp/Fnr family transcriptional regulator [Flavisolibacter sp.]